MYKRGKKFQWYVQLLQEVFPNFSAIREPLVRLTKKFTKYEWSKDCNGAFDFLKENLTTVPDLAYPDTIKPCILYTDASDDCTGECLYQEQDTEGEIKSNNPNEKLIHCLSHKLTVSQMNWPTIEKEAYAIFYAQQELYQYLHNCVIRKDHKSLRYIMDSPVQNKKIQHWTTSIHGYNCKIEYIEGKKNICGDKLSHLPHRPSDSNDDNELCGPDIICKAIEVSIVW